MLRITNCLIFLFLAGMVHAQSVWTDMPEKDITLQGERWIIPERYRTVEYNLDALKAALSAAPLRAELSGDQAVVTLPMPDGTTSRFRLFSTPVMAPALQAKYPEIQCYTGFGIDDPGARLKCDFTPWGFHAMISSGRHSPVFIDPYIHGDATFGIVYYKKDYKKRANATYPCATEALPDVTHLSGGVASRNNDGQLRTYRLALACTGEYALFHGDTKPLVLAAMNTSMNRVNGVYENEFSVTMQIIANTDTLIFLDGDNDPYTNNDGGTMLGENKLTCNQRIGSSNYDMGHVFSTGGGGIAGLGVVCTGDKAHGVTGQAAPIGDAFDIDYVAHEMGHQFNGNHTQNNDCNRAGNTSMEPGSASTIMGYAGICSPDVQPHSDDYFHGVNVEEIVGFIVAGAGDGCPVKTPTNNIAPQVNGGTDYVIPKSTPFALTALGNDADNDFLTYCWEQMDPEVGPQPPEPTSTKGPLFRSFVPNPSPVHYFPDLEDLINNVNSDWEELPGVARTMNFRITVRDNHSTGGSTDWDDVLLTVAANAGPFVVTAPNTGNPVWHSGEFQVVTWNVANTDKAPVNCQTVNVLLSTDGGHTYPISLASGVPNSGKCCVKVPDIEITNARIRIEAVNNIFFDISNSDFSIQAATQPGFSICPAEYAALVCLPETYTTSLSTSGVAGFDQPISFSATGMPPGTTATFSPNPAMPGSDVVMTIDMPEGLPEGVSTVSIQAVSDTLSAGTVSTLTLVSNDFSTFSLKTPLDGATGLPQGVTLHWNGTPAANTYDVQFATNPSFNPDVILYTKSGVLADSLKVPLILPKSQLYYWRVRAANECGAGPWSEPYVFVTIVESCLQFTANDLPKVISGNSTPTIESKITINSGGPISDVNVSQIKGFHEFFKDLEATLISPQGTQVLLFKNKCGNYNGSFNFALDDAAAAMFPCPPPNNGLGYNAQNPLTPFIGQNSTGEWTLRIKDNTIGSGGSLSEFKLEICSSVALQAPVLINNNVLQLQPGTNSTIANDLLLTEDPNNTHDQLIYTLLTIPKHGLLETFANADIKPGDQFSQSDIDNGALHYFDFGLNTGGDDFRFAVTDGEGGLVTATFVIEPFPLGNKSPDQQMSFTMAPNPATESVRLLFTEAIPSGTRVVLFNSMGQALRNWSPASGSNIFDLNLADLPAGAYAVSVQHERGNNIRKLIKN